MGNQFSFEVDSGQFVSNGFGRRPCPRPPSDRSRRHRPLSPRPETRCAEWSVRRPVFPS